MGQLIPGLPDRAVYGHLSQLEPDRVYTLLRQLHKAQRAGKHVDVRIGDPGLGLLSFAAPKDLPQQEGQKRLLIRQPLHEWSYKDFQGTIGKGYGKGTVQKLEEVPVAVLYNKDNKIKFTRADKKNSPIYTMVRTKNGNWITTIKTEDNPPEVLLYDKQHFKNVQLKDAADMMDTGASATVKIDGAGALAILKTHGIDVYGINKDKYGNAIRYTDLIGGLRDIPVPKPLVGTVLRAQVAGQQNGKALPVQQLSGLLNSTLQHNIQNRRNRGISLGLVALAVNKGGKDDYDKEKLNRIVSQLNTKKVVQLPVIKTKEELNKQLDMMRSGKHPMTSQGVVVVPSGQRPLKAKLVNDADVIVREIFPADTKGKPRAGGFSYSLPGKQEISGSVGSGIDHALLQDMLNKPKDYIGRTAVIESMQQYPSGAYRMPVFKSFRVQGD